MILFDYILIGLAVCCGVVGAIVGFGKELKFFTKGFFGIVISIIVCYFIFGCLLNVGFINRLLEAFRNALDKNGSGFCKFLLTIRIDYIVYAIVLFAIVQILRIGIVKLINKVCLRDNLLIKILNKTFGLILAIGVLCVLILIAMQLYSVIGGVPTQMPNVFSGSFFRLDYIFANNPLNAIF